MDMDRETDMDMDMDFVHVHVRVTVYMSIFKVMLINSTLVYFRRLVIFDVR